MNEILLVEDDVNLGKSLKEHLTGEGYQVTHCATLASATETHNKSFSLIILDWKLPDGQGIDFLKDLRNQGDQTPIIMLTARAELIDKVIGLESGANDYVTKPFEPRELDARIRVQLRTPKAQSKEEKSLVFHDVTLNLETRECLYKEKSIEMTKMEFELLALLASHPGKAFSRDEILNKVWGFENFPTTRTVDTHVLQVRQKLFDDLIETVRGIGYRLKKQT